MAAKEDDKRIFLIASGDSGNANRIKDLIEQHISKATVYLASDGLTALAKVTNAPPQVLISDMELPKLAGLKLIDEVLALREAETTAFVIVGTPPQEGQHLDELVTGRVNYWTNQDDENEFVSRLVRALNFSTHQENAEFYLRFVAQDEILLREGDKAEYVYFVKKGHLEAFSNRAGEPVTLGTIDTGEFVGEMAYINGEPRSASVKAASDCELIEVPLDQFSNVLFKRPSWSKALMVTLSKRIRAANHGKLQTS